MQAQKSYWTRMLELGFDPRPEVSRPLYSHYTTLSKCDIGLFGQHMYCFVERQEGSCNFCQLPTVAQI